MCIVSLLELNYKGTTHGVHQLDGWVLDLGDGGDGIHVDFVEVFSGIYDLILRE